MNRGLPGGESGVADYPLAGSFTTTTMADNAMTAPIRLASTGAWNPK